MKEEQYALNRARLNLDDSVQVLIKTRKEYDKALESYENRVKELLDAQSCLSKKIMSTEAAAQH